MEKQKIVDAVRERFSGRAVVELKTMLKSDGREHAKICVSPIGASSGVAVDIEYFTIGLDGKDFDSGMDELIRNIEFSLEDSTKFIKDTDWVDDWEKAKEKLAMRVIALEKGAELKETCPTRTMEDIMQYLVVQLDLEGGIGTTIVTNKIAKMWGKTEEELFQAAEDARKNETEIFELGSFLEQEYGYQAEETTELYIVSNANRIHGAGNLFYTGIMKEIYERIGRRNYFIIPSSVHEILIHKDTGKLNGSELKLMIQEVNKTCVAEKDRLTESVYYYLGSTDKFMKVL